MFNNCLAPVVGSEHTSEDQCELWGKRFLLESVYLSHLLLIYFLAAIFKVKEAVKTNNHLYILLGFCWCYQLKKIEN